MISCAPRKSRADLRKRVSRGASATSSSPNRTCIARAGLLLHAIPFAVAGIRGEQHRREASVRRRALRGAMREARQENPWWRPRGEFCVAQHGREERLVGRRRRARRYRRARARGVRAPRRASRHARSPWRSSSRNAAEFPRWIRAHGRCVRPQPGATRRCVPDWGRKFASDPRHTAAPRWHGRKSGCRPAVW